MKKYVYTIDRNEFDIDLNFSQIIEITLDHINAKPHCEFSIVFIDDEYMQELNLKYNGYAQPTDVLSFESGEMDLDSGFLYLGDILIAYPFVKQQAQNLNNLLDSELALMIIHGLLHLCGFDHDTPQKKKKMWQKQFQILDLLNIQLNKLPE